MTLQEPGDAQLLKTLLVALDRLQEVPPGHLKRLSPMLNHRLRDVILAYLSFRELAQRQQVAVAVRAAPPGHGAIRTH